MAHEESGDLRCGGRSQSAAGREEAEGEPINRAVKNTGGERGGETPACEASREPSGSGGESARAEVHGPPKKERKSEGSAGGEERAQVGAPGGEGSGAGGARGSQRRSKSGGKGAEKNKVVDSIRSIAAAIAVLFLR